jgi:hypothetical protein
MALPIEDVLALWREADRVLDELPPDAADRSRVQAELDSLRTLYARLTDGTTLSTEKLAVSKAAIERSQRVIAQARARIERAAG